MAAFFVVFNISCTSQILTNSSKHESGQAIGPIAFAVIGDGPYGVNKEAAYDRLIKTINNDPDVRFVIHVGDIKSGSAECTNERLQRRFEQLQQIKTALIYTPGDNEWTDCHRESSGSWHPLERLSFVRQLFFPNPGMTTGQNPRPVHTQADNPDFAKYVENALFVENDVVISTIHVVGSNNNLMPWSGIDPADSFEMPREDRIMNLMIAKRHRLIGWSRPSSWRTNKTPKAYLLLFMLIQKSSCHPRTVTVPVLTIF